MAQLRRFFDRRMIATFMLGLTSGLPLLLTGSTLQAWMTEENVSLKLIGLATMIGLPYTLKFLWSPIMDRFIPPFWGRRRGWITITQLALFVAFFLLSMTNPQTSLTLVAICALLVTFCSASQDIVVDAYRREILEEEELGYGSSLYIFGDRMGMLLGGALALLLASKIPWKSVYLMYGFFFLGFAFLNGFYPEVDAKIKPPKTLKEAVVAPLIDYFKRKGAIEILAFILLYKVGDLMATAMTTPFILKVGFSKEELGLIAKSFGMASTIIGGLIGGVIIYRLGIRKSLFLFGILQGISTATFALLAVFGKDNTLLMGLVTFEYLAIGMGTAAYSAFMASITNTRFSATQYALLSSLMGIPRVIISAPTGFLAEKVGWVMFFIICGLAAIPGLLLLTRYSKWEKLPAYHPPTS